MATARITQQTDRDNVTYTTVLEVQVEGSYPDAVDEAVSAVRRMWDETMVD